jgi:drug/metabolite transporter (DMT)-like permease
MPLFTVMLAHYFTQDEKITANKLVGVLIGIAGVTVIVGEHGIDFSSGSSFAKIAILAAPLSYAVAALIARRFAAWNLSPLFVAFGQSATAAIIALPLATFVENPWGLSVSAPVWSALIALGLLCSSVAYFLYFRLIAVAGATNTSLITLSIPPFAVISGVILLGESLSLVQLLGMALILFGLVVTDGRLKLRKPQRAV